MKIAITERGADGSIIKAQSEDGRYQWFVGQESYLWDTEANRSIYQMAYLRAQGFGSDPLPEQVSADARSFWGALRDAQKGAESEQSVRIRTEIAAVPQISDAEFEERRRREREWDDRYNEGGEGFNPSRSA